MNKQGEKYVLDPYKTIGCFVHGPVTCSKTQPFSIAAACYSSFKIYSQQLAIKMVSGNFEGPIRAIHIHNECSYVIVGTEIIKIKYHHIVRKWQMASFLSHSSPKSKNKQHCSMLVFDGVIIVSLGDSIYTIPEELAKDRNIEQGENDQIQQINLGINIKQIVHPVTYVNKVLAYSSEKILLVNPITQKILFDYQNLSNEILQNEKKINIVTASPLVDIVAVCLDSGQIVIINIRNSKVVFTMKQKKPVTAIVFSQGDSLMATGDETGNIILWDLQNKKILYRLQGAFSHSVSNLFFVPGTPLLTATSSKANSIKQFRINLDDSKTLLQHRQRTGCSSLCPIKSFKCHNNKQITFQTRDETIFSSLYSHSNMYSLPYCLDSLLPYHLAARNYSIELYRQRSIIGKLNIKQNAQIAKFSISKKFILVGTKSRLIKIAVPAGSTPSTVLHIALQWKINDILDILLHMQHFIYVLSFDAIHVFNFNDSTLVATINQGCSCYNPVTNLNQTMMALQNRTKQAIEIWDMRSMKLCRQFTHNKNKENTSNLCFSSDNKFLLSAHLNSTIIIWSILHNNLYKVVHLQATVISMCFTPDNSYFLSLFENSKQINIWHNYIGKITSSQNQNISYKFQTQLYELTGDYRSQLNSSSVPKHNLDQIEQENDMFNHLLDKIPDPVNNSAHNYDFANVSRWMPLVYYDEIKNRNSINKKDEDIPALPFFLDFKNLNEEQEKLNNKVKQELRERKNKQKQKIDSQLSNDRHEIVLNQSSGPAEFQGTWKILTQISVAEADYQLRRFLILPGNCEKILKMFAYLLQKSYKRNFMLINILLIRTLDIAGSQICSESYKQTGRILLQKIQTTLNRQQSLIYRCTALASQNNR